MLIIAIGIDPIMTAPSGILRNAGQGVSFATPPPNPNASDSFFSTAPAEHFVPTAPRSSIPRGDHILPQHQMPAHASKPAPKEAKQIKIAASDSDLGDLFFVAPPVVKAGTSNYAICICLLPFSVMNQNWIKVSLNSNLRSAVVTFTTPQYLLKAGRLAGTNLRGTHNVVRQAFSDSLQSRLRQNGLRSDDNISHDVHLDLPFEAEPTTSADLFSNNRKTGQVVAYSYVGPEFIDVNHSQPGDYLSTLVIVFKERENTFGSSRKVESTIKEDLDSSGENWW